MALDFAAGSLDFASYAANGGEWFIALPPQDRSPYLQAFGELPIAMEIETIHGLIGIVHAECPVSRWSFPPRSILISPGDCVPVVAGERIQHGRDDDVSRARW